MLGLAVVTPWFATPDAPFAGAFVSQWTRSLQAEPSTVTVIHLHVVAPGTETAPERRTEPWGTVVRIPIELEPNAPRIDVARAQAQALTDHAPQEYWDADVVHAHVGLPTAWAVTQVPPPRARIVTIEHASYLTTLLKRDDTRPAYGELLESSHMHLMAGEREARMVRGMFPEQRNKIVAVGNPVDDDCFYPRESAPTHLQHWLYAGNITEAKGVARAVTLYIAWRDRHPDQPGSFTFAGQGPASAEVRAIADASPWGHEVHLVGAKTAAELGDMMRQADVLVHLSHKETFGLTVVEAAMCGAAVVTTRCGGPQDTLAEAFDAGQALLLHVDARPEDLDLLDDFAARLPDARFSAADHLRTRYGAHAFGEHLREVSAGGNPFTAPAGAPKVGVLATSRQGLKLAQHLAAVVVGAGAVPVVASSPARELSVLDPRAIGVDLSGVGTAPGAFFYLRVLYIWPVLVVGIPARWIAARLGRLSGSVGKYGRTLRKAISRRIDAARQKKQAVTMQPRGIAGPFWKVAAPVSAAIRAADDRLLHDGAPWIVCDGQAKALLSALEKECEFSSQRVDASAAGIAEVVADHIARTAQVR